MTKWQLQDAKARFSELIDDTLEKGPQIVTRRGIDTAVIVSFTEWRRLQETGRPTLTGALPVNFDYVVSPGQKRGVRVAEVETARGGSRVVRGTFSGRHVCARRCS